jgi:hypothetical protein
VALNQAIVFAVAAALLQPAQLTNDQAAAAARACFGDDGRFASEVRAYSGCVQQQAARLEPSGEAADAIATAALAACGQEKQKLSATANLCSMVYSQAGLVSPTWGRQAIEGAETGARGVATRIVVEARAAKAAGH